MVKRKIIFDKYDTAVYFWTLASWSCPTPEPLTAQVEVLGRIDGPLDVSTALTGDIRYGSRPLDVRLESSEGTRLERKARIDDLVDRLHGQRVKVWVPDDPDHYLVARLSVTPEYNTLAHTAVVIKGTCEPWKYANDETEVAATAKGETPYAVKLPNDRRPVCPSIVVKGSVRIEYNGGSFTLTEGTYKLPDIILTEGENVAQVTGSGSVTFTYRKAVL